MLVGAGLWTAGLGAAEPVAVATKPAGPWKTYATRSLDDLPALAAARPDAGLTPYGGTRAVAVPAPRRPFFQVVQAPGGRWWLVDPTGAAYLDRAVVSVTMTPTPKAVAALNATFGGEAGWAARTNAWLRELGFTSTGAWSDHARLGAAPGRLAYTTMLNFMSSYGRKRGGTYQKPGHTGYPQDAIFVFDPEFEAFCDEHARALAATKDDPWLLGHFTDNELPLQRAALTNYLALPETDAGHRAARAWLRERRGGRDEAASPSDAEKEAFLEFVTDRYHRIVTTAVRRHDPNHLILGSRLHGQAMRYPEVWRAAGRYLDVVAVNYYHAWTPDPERLAMWANEAKRPFLVTEWYAKGMDAVGLTNESGAGWTVKTQRDRGLFYENFTLGLLAAKHCVGWQWFKYQDNDPENLKVDPSNRDSNKGIVTNRYEPYPELVTRMRRINERVYQLVEHFDRTER